MEQLKDRGMEFEALAQREPAEAGWGNAAIPQRRAVRRGYLAFKRAADLAGAAAGLIVLSPLLLAVAALIKLNDRGSVIYRRVCVGKNGKEYVMYKFRTMIENAEEKTDLFTAETLCKHLAGDKTIEDPRITKIGKFLRRTSLDELPQLVSVLRGDMSLVGPRPVVRREAEEYGADRDLLLSVKPGITGWWQVKGRKGCPFLSREAKTLQLYYARHQSPWLDIKILLLTVKAVLLRKDIP